MFILCSTFLVSKNDTCVLLSNATFTQGFTLSEDNAWFFNLRKSWGCEGFITNVSDVGGKLADSA
jgi:hypothetical protein